MILPTKALFDFSKLLAILQRFPHPSLFRLEGDILWRTIQHNGQAILLRYDAVEGGIALDAINHELSPEIRQQAEFIIGTDVDHRDFYDVAKQNDLLWQVVQPLVGLPVERTESVFQALVFVIIEQHISWVAAQKAQRKLVEWANNTIVYDGYTYYAMLTPEQLASATIDDLKPLKITFKRMQLLIDIAQQIVDGTLDLEAMLEQSPDTMYKNLIKIKGVGHWTASVVLARARGIFSYVPHNDVAVQAAVQRYFYGDEGKKSSDNLNAVFEPMGEFAGLAAHYTLMHWVLDEYLIQPQD